jgi:hypothetical protein
MDPIRHHLVTIRQTELRAEADAVRLAATASRPARGAGAAGAAAWRPFGTLRRLVGGATGFATVAE